MGGQYSYKKKTPDFEPPSTTTTTTTTTHRVNGAEYIGYRRCVFVYK